MLLWNFKTAFKCSNYLFRIDQHDEDKYLIFFNIYNISAAGFLTAPTALDSVDEYRGITFDTISEYQCSTIFIQPLQKTGRIRIQGSKIFFWCFITLYLILRPKKYFYHNQILVSGTKTIEIDSRLLESVRSTKTNTECIQVNNPPDN